MVEGFMDLITLLPHQVARVTVGRITYDIVVVRHEDRLTDYTLTVWRGNEDFPCNELNFVSANAAVRMMDNLAPLDQWQIYQR